MFITGVILVTIFVFNLGWFTKTASLNSESNRVHKTLDSFVTQLNNQDVPKSYARMSNDYKANKSLQDFEGLVKQANLSGLTLNENILFKGTDDSSYVLSRTYTNEDNTKTVVISIVGIVNSKGIEISNISIT